MTIHFLEAPIEVKDVDLGDYKFAKAIPYKWHVTYFFRARSETFNFVDALRKSLGKPQFSDNVVAYPKDDWYFNRKEVQVTTVERCWKFDVYLTKEDQVTFLALKYPRSVPNLEEYKDV